MEEKDCGTGEDKAGLDGRGKESKYLLPIYLCILSHDIRSMGVRTHTYTHTTRQSLCLYVHAHTI